MSKNTKYSFAKIALFAAVLAATPLVISNVNADSTGADDASLYKMAREAVLPYDTFFNNVIVSARNGIVTISGEVDNWQQREDAEREVSEILGVTKVINDLGVQAGSGK